MLKKFDKKFIYICGILLGLPIILIIFLAMFRGCSSGVSYSSYENKMVSAAKKYVKEKKKSPKIDGEVVTINLDDLIKDDYIKDPEKALEDNSCTGSVTVRNNGSSVESNKGGYYMYIPDLKCDKYKTTHIIDKLMEDVVTSKSGLYQVEDGYVYKGDKVNNYISFFDKKYRILSIDSNGILKLVKVSPEKSRITWDKKYNTESKKISGKNDYSDSNIIDELLTKYTKMSEKQKQHMIGYNVCYGNRSLEYKNVDKANECYKTLENQFVSVMNTYDYAMASYDTECNKIAAGSCRNYNYLYNTLDTTWLMNGVLDNSYEVYYYATGTIETSNANASRKYNMVIYIDGNELFDKGDGSENNPYIIK